MKKRLTNINLTWKKLIIFAIIIGIYTGVVAMIPGFDDTSLKDISISFECWILFGTFIILNSKSSKDSALKCFVFFLISQPLVYLVQVPFHEMGWELFTYYKGWFIWTLFTIPMGYIGYNIKKGNMLSLAILTPILIFVAIHAYTFLREVINFFPNHLISFVFCILTMLLYVHCIFDNKKERRIGFIICALLTIVIIVLCLLPLSEKTATYNTTIKCNSETIVFDNTYNVYLTDESYGKVYITDEYGGYCINSEFKKTGKTKLVIEKDENKYMFDLNIGRNTYSLTEIVE